MRVPGPLRLARFISRPNRFLTVVDLEGEPVEAHLPDPGRLKELLLPGARVWVRSASAPHRKTRYTLALVEAPSGELVSVVTTLPNEMVGEALRAGWIAELADWRIEAREHTWGRSRFDFLLVRGEEKRMLLEVKSVTLVEDRRALFPDAVTARGARHVRELAEAMGLGFEATVLFVVQRRDATSVTAARAIDPSFANALKGASEAGVHLLGYRCEITLEAARITEPLPVFVGSCQ
jgi:sugar fermentation stimulation protein A